MPKSFENCVAKGGRVRTIKSKGKKSKTYLHTCYLDGKSYHGEIKQKK